LRASDAIRKTTLVFIWIYSILFGIQCSTGELYGEERSESSVHDQVVEENGISGIISVYRYNIHSTPLSCHVVASFYLLIESQTESLQM
jgi:hypothetical protein